MKHSDSSEGLIFFFIALHVVIFLSILLHWLKEQLP